MNWVLLLGAGVFEVVWTVALKKSDGFRNIWADAVFLTHCTAPQDAFFSSMPEAEIESCRSWNAPGYGKRRPPVHSALEFSLFWARLDRRAKKTRQSPAKRAVSKNG